MIEEILKSLVIIFSAIVLHEYAHGWTADKLGDPTARMAGRLTLNPVKHIDPIGSILIPGILLTLSMLGHGNVLFGWAKPVPVNFMRLHNPKQDMMLVGMAGPAMNVALALVCSFLLRLGPAPASVYYLELAIFINLLLAIFNMIPIPPLDGSRLVMGLLPRRMAVAYSRLEPYGILIVFIFLYFGLFSAIVLPLVKVASTLLGVSDS